MFYRRAASRYESPNNQRSSLSVDAALIKDHFVSFMFEGFPHSLNTIMVYARKNLDDRNTCLTVVPPSDMKIKIPIEHPYQRTQPSLEKTV